MCHVEWKQQIPLVQPFLTEMRFVAVFALCKAFEKKNISIPTDVMKRMVLPALPCVDSIRSYHGPHVKAGNLAPTPSSRSELFERAKAFWMSTVQATVFVCNEGRNRDVRLNIGFRKKPSHEILCKLKESRGMWYNYRWHLPLENAALLAKLLGHQHPLAILIAPFVQNVQAKINVRAKIQAQPRTPSSDGDDDWTPTARRGSTPNAANRRKSARIRERSDD